MIAIDLPSSPHTGYPAPDKPSLTRFVNRARIATGLKGTVSVLLTTDAELKRLNRIFRNKNKPTDILSFPAPPEVALHHAGDLAISLDTATRQAHEHGHPLAAEVRVLLLHGLLHLSGLDHETDTGEMAARESELRTRFRLPNTLIARTNPQTLLPSTKPPSSRLKSSQSEDAVERPLSSIRTAKHISARPRPTKPSRQTTANRQRRTPR